jgi:hypothetical protein
MRRTVYSAAAAAANFARLFRCQSISAMPLEGSMNISPARLCLALLISASIGAAAATVRAENFRIETKIFTSDADDKKALPVSETTTLFFDGVVYDFIDEPAQIAVFRKSQGGKPGRFILLDPKHLIKTELSTAQLTGAMEKLRKWAGQQTDPLLIFAADPKFKESFEQDKGELILASHLESYTVTTRPADNPQALIEYREFLDWYAQLNTLLGAGPPPEPRLRLNEALQRYQVLPLKVELTRASEKQPLRAEHEFTWRLSRQDADKIDKVRASLASYRTVSNQEFLSTTKPDTLAE